MRDGYSYSEAGRLGAIASYETIQAAKKERIARYNEDPKKCRYCSAPIPYEKKRTHSFCSHSCAASYNNRGICRNVQSELIKELKHCRHCGEVIPRKKCYCNTECNLAYRRKVSNERVLDHLIRNEKELSIGLIEAEDTKKMSSRRIRNFLLRTRERKCSCCQQTHWLDHEIPLEVDHANGNSSDNSPENLRLICPNCHALTPTYKGKNRGNGRAKRRERYHQGKSY